MSVICRSREGAWIEITKTERIRSIKRVAPARERGLKLMPRSYYPYKQPCRSREGAWIEIMTKDMYCIAESVAPARERGLKYSKLEELVKEGKVAPARERGLK